MLPTPRAWAGGVEAFQRGCSRSKAGGLPTAQSRCSQSAFWPARSGITARMPRLRRVWRIARAE